jgi:hypothetical protein
METGREPSSSFSIHDSYFFQCLVRLGVRPTVFNIHFTSFLVGKVRVSLAAPHRSEPKQRSTLFLFLPTRDNTMLQGRISRLLE